MFEGAPVSTKLLFLATLLLGWCTLAYAQTPTGDCVPIQGQGWQGCAPTGANQQPQQPMSPSARWADRWGALATDDIAGILGVSINMLSKRTAEDVALKDCQAKGGSKCEALGAYHNQCVAMVSGHNGYDVAVGPTIEKAVEESTQSCSSKSADCHVYYSACSYPVRVQ
jgi:hypothetical protein